MITAIDVYRAHKRDYFSLQHENWSEYVERLQHYFTADDIATDSTWMELAGSLMSRLENILPSRQEPDPTRCPEQAL